VLYWLPWLAKLRKDLKLAPERLIPIGRGGSAVWYGTPAGFELYAMRDPKAVRIETRTQHQKTQMLKQTELTAFDRSVLEDAAHTLSLKRPLWIHPSQMYRELAPYWEGKTGLAWILKQCAFTIPIAPPPLPDGLALPEKFIAARFYARWTWPANEHTAQAARAIIAKIATDVPVVLLDNGGLHLDDHLDFAPKTLPPNVYRLSDLAPGMNAETNLAIQSAVLAQASGFVGTYGGFSQLALLLGKPNISFYERWGETSIAHKHLADFLSSQSGVPCLVLALNQLAVLQSVLPEMVIYSPQHVVPDEPMAVVG